MTVNPILTVGHSTHPQERFLELLRSHNVNFVVDVRSVPFSRRAPHFSKAKLRIWLPYASVQYAHLPEAFGARKRDPSLLDAEQRVDFDRVRASDAFRNGVAHLKRGATKGYRIALMCAEADPFDCHRFSMITYQLIREGVEVKHILRDGSVIDNEVLENRLRLEYGFTSQSDMFGKSTDPVVQIEKAYRQRGRDVAYSVKEVNE